MLFLRHPKVLHKHCLQFLLEVKKWPQEKLKTMLMQNFGVTNKEHYGMLWYFLEWSIPKYWSSLIGHRVPDFSSWHTCARFNLVPRVSQRGCARLCTRGVCTGSSKSKWRVSEKGKMRCNNDIKHVVEKLRIEISNRNIDELRERAC